MVQGPQERNDEGGEHQNTRKRSSWKVDTGTPQA